MTKATQEIEIGSILDNFAAWIGTKEINGTSRKDATDEIMQLIENCIEEEKKKWTK